MPASRNLFSSGEKTLRDFFIETMEKIINAVIILGAVAVVLGGIAVMFEPNGGFLKGVFVWLGGALYLILMGGAVYLGLGIYYNTRRTAEAVERLSQRP